MSHGADGRQQWPLQQPDGSYRYVAWDEIPEDLRSAAEPVDEHRDSTTHDALPSAPARGSQGVLHDTAPVPGSLQSSPGASWFGPSPAIAVGLLLFVAGLIFGFVPTSIAGDDGGDDRLPCGSVFVTAYTHFDRDEPENSYVLSSSGAGLCDQRRDARLLLTWGPLLAGAALAGAGSIGRLNRH